MREVSVKSETFSADDGVLRANRCFSFGGAIPTVPASGGHLQEVLSKSAVLVIEPAPVVRRIVLNGQKPLDPNSLLLVIAAPKQSFHYDSNGLLVNDSPKRGQRCRIRWLVAPSRAQLVRVADIEQRSGCYAVEDVHRRDFSKAAIGHA